MRSVTLKDLGQREQRNCTFSLCEVVFATGWRDIITSDDLLSMEGGTALRSDHLSTKRLSRAEHRAIGPALAWLLPTTSNSPVLSDLSTAGQDMRRKTIMKNWTSRTTSALAMATLVLITDAARAGEYNTDKIGDVRRQAHRDLTLTCTPQGYVTRCLEQEQQSHHPTGLLKTPAPHQRHRKQQHRMFGPRFAPPTLPAASSCCTIPTWNALPMSARPAEQKNCEPYTTTGYTLSVYTPA